MNLKTMNVVPLSKLFVHELWLNSQLRWIQCVRKSKLFDQARLRRHDFNCVFCTRHIRLQKLDNFSYSVSSDAVPEIAKINSGKLIISRNFNFFELYVEHAWNKILRSYSDLNFVYFILLFRSFLNRRVFNSNCIFDFKTTSCAKLELIYKIINMWHLNNYHC